MTAPEMLDLRATALDYARRGLEVFPLQVRGKAPLQGTRGYSMPPPTSRPSSSGGDPPTRHGTSACVYPSGSSYWTWIRATVATSTRSVPYPRPGSRAPDRAATTCGSAGQVQREGSSQTPTVSTSRPDPGISLSRRACIRAVAATSGSRRTRSPRCLVTFTSGCVRHRRASGAVCSPHVRCPATAGKDSSTTWRPRRRVSGTAGCFGRRVVLPRSTPPRPSFTLWRVPPRRLVCLNGRSIEPLLRLDRRRPHEQPAAVPQGEAEG